MNLPDLTTQTPSAPPSSAPTEMTAPENATTESQTPGAASGSSSEHLDAIDVAALEPEGTGAGIGGELAPAAPATLTKDQFHATFVAMFGLGSKLSGLKALEVGPADGDARAASDAIYDTAEEVPWLRFLIEPGNIYVQRALAVGVFAFGKYSAVKAEIAARQPPRPASPAARSTVGNDSTLASGDVLAAFPKDRAA